MTAKERFIETMLFGNPDKIPLNPGWPRESTLNVWRTQGLAEESDFMHAVLDELGIPHEAALRFEQVGVSFEMIPEFETKVLAHKEGHYVIRDHMGAVTEISDQFDASYLRRAKDFVTRKWHKFPVETPEDWEAMKKRYDPHDPQRFTSDAIDRCDALKKSDQVVSLNFDGVFWQLRDWCGFENLCIMMLEQPEFVQEMAEFWGDFVAEVLESVLKVIAPDRVFISEDMAYKAHSMISPEMTRQFILPQYKKWIPLIHHAGCKVIELDSDGCIDVLVPLWIEAGINCCSPIEVAAYCDILDYRKKYGKKMAYMQGIDKRIMARGGDELEQHVMKIVPALFKEGGFIPGCDHGVPPDISWKNYIEFTRMIAKLSGW